MYKSPIEIVNGGLQTQLEGEILRAVQKVDVVVDKDELMRALAYDRDQYQKGFGEGVESVRRWISVEERLPETEDVFLCWSRDLSDMMFCYTSDFEQMEVTHWMSLPEPPAATLNQKQEL